MPAFKDLKERGGAHISSHVAFKSFVKSRAHSHTRAKKTQNKKKIPPSALYRYNIRYRKKEKEGESFSSPFYAEIRFFYAERRLSFFLRRGPGLSSHLRPYASAATPKTHTRARRCRSARRAILTSRASSRRLTRRRILAASECTGPAWNRNSDPPRAFLGGRAGSHTPTEERAQAQQRSRRGGR